jgi:periplasmic divalent cation tolerance protein
MEKCKGLTIFQNTFARYAKATVLMQHPSPEASFLPTSSPVVVLITCPSQSVALQLSRALVAEGMVACVNIVPGITSVYQWEGALHEDAEVLMVIKTTQKAVAAIITYMTKHHPYTCPEVIALPIVDGSKTYLAWLAQQPPWRSAHGPL